MTTMPPLSLLAKTTLQTIREQILRRGDLPGLAGAVRLIESAVQDESDSEGRLVQGVLGDPALTQKVLRLANSTMYSAFGRKVETVSRAVAVLGTDAIGHLALNQQIVSDLTSLVAKGCESTQQSMETAVLAGHVARQIAGSSSKADAETAVICALLQSLGEMLVSFYLPKEWAQIQSRASQGSMSTEQACSDLIGLTLPGIGEALAAEWGIPAKIVEGLRPIAPRAITEPISHADWLSGVATLSSQCAVLLSKPEAPEALAELALSYSEMLGVSVDTVVHAVAEAQIQAVAEGLVTDVRAKAPVSITNVLYAGIADMTRDGQRLSPNKVMGIALETMYRALNFSRVFTFVRNRKDACYVAKDALGLGAPELLPLLTFNDGFRPDAFHAALASDRITLIEDSTALAKAGKMPLWWVNRLNSAKSFIILPISVKGKPIGFIYGEWPDSSKLPSLTVDESAALGALRTAVLDNITQYSAVTTVEV